MTLNCPHCGEQILSRRKGFCPGCHADLPEGMKFDEKSAEFMDKEYERALRSASGGSNSSDGGCPGDGGLGFGGDCGGDGGGDGGF